MLKPGPGKRLIVTINETAREVRGASRGQALQPDGDCRAIARGRRSAPRRSVCRRFPIPQFVLRSARLSTAVEFAGTAMSRCSAWPMTPTGKR